MTQIRCIGYEEYPDLDSQMGLHRWFGEAVPERYR